LRDPHIETVILSNNIVEIFGSYNFVRCSCIRNFKNNDPSYKLAKTGMACLDGNPI